MDFAITPLRIPWSVGKANTMKAIAFRTMLNLYPTGTLSMVLHAACGIRLA